MKMKLHPDMIEATRLTRQGRLTEAYSLMQRLLRNTGEPGTDVNKTRSSPSGFAAIKTIEASSVDAVDSPPTPSWAKRFAGRIVQSPTTPVESIGIKSGVRPSAAANAPSQAGEFLNATFTHNSAGTRAYKLYVPNAYNGQPLPLIVMMHGCTQSPDDFAAGTRMNAIAEERGCFVAYPAQPSSANGSKCWNWFTPDNQQRDKGEPALIAGMTRQIARDYAIDPKRIYVAGLSAGGAAAAVLAAAYPDIYAAVGVHSGLACGAASDITSALTAMRTGNPPSPKLVPLSPASLAVARHVPTIVFHGDKDQTVHLRNGHHVIDQSRTSGVADLRLVTKPGQVTGGRAYSQTCHLDTNGKTIIEMWVVHGSGHAWSGGSAAGSYTDPRGPDASAEMIRFFLENPHQ